MATVTYTNLNYYYITNDKYAYPDTGDGAPSFNTGWHIIPNQQFDEWLTLGQWWDLQTKSATFKPVSASCTIQNMIPISTQVAIQGTSTFSAFNNTIYALAYSDEAYETQPFEFTGTHLPLEYREGFNVLSSGSTTRYLLPTYTHVMHNTDIGMAFWDPFVNSEQLFELRPGKNAVQLSWHVSDGDSHITYNTARQQQFPREPGVPTNSTMSEDYDFKNSNVTPNNLAMIWFRHNAPDGMQDLYRKSGSETLQFKKPIPQWFIKLIPLLDDKSNLIKTQAQICIYKKITFEVTPFKPAVNRPILPNYYIHGATDRIYKVKYPEFHAQEYVAKNNAMMYELSKKGHTVDHESITYPIYREQVPPDQIKPFDGTSNELRLPRRRG